MNAIQIKSYLFPETVQHVTADKLTEANEIRRFALTMLPSGVHGLLVDRLQAAYGDLLPNKNEIRCYWLDEENELVGFSTDAELQYAIDLQTAIRVSNPSMSMSMIGQPLQQSSSVFKVYVTRRSAKQAHENQSEPQLHPGVVCDGCQGPIVGIRYKCTVCPDYDLCGECEAKALHREHPLTKISRPMGGGMRCPYMGGRHQRGPCGGGRGGASSRRPYHHGFGSGSMSFQESLNNILPNIPIVNDQEQLKKFGEYMKGLLDPFGIDVDYFISQNEQQKKKNEEEKATARDKSATEKKDEEMPPETAESTIKKEEPKDLLTGSRVETASAAIATAATTSLTPEQSEPVIRVLTPQTSPTAPPSAAALLTATLNPFEQAASALKAKIDEPITNGSDDSMKSVNSSFLNSPSKSNSTTAMTHQDEETDNGFNLVDIEKELRYINSVEQLKAMGYTDDSGWLTRLVIAKNGNINAVLDALNPK